VKEE